MFTAQTETGKVITVTKTNRDLLEKNKMRYVCCCCQEEVILKNGDIKVPHFAHKKGGKCKTASEGESAKHLKAKELLLGWLSAQAFQVDLEHYFSEIKRQADLFVEGNIVLEYQCSTIPIKEMIERTENYLSLSLKPYWILGQELTMRGGKYLFSAFQLAFLLKDKDLGYYLFCFHPEEKCFELIYHIHHYVGKYFFASSMKLPLSISLEEMQAKIARIRFKSLYIKRNRKMEREHLSYFYAKYKSKSMFSKQLYQSGYAILNLPSEIGVQLSRQFLTHTPALEWQFLLWENFFKLLEVGDTFSKEHIVQYFRKYVVGIKMIFLPLNECHLLLEEYLLFLESEGVLVEYIAGRFRIKRQIIYIEKLFR
ncbi:MULTISPECIES: competence protein CoiA family protein [unclassified Listeria]|uniref:competence protein CoiA family protein n=1 Tax=unclassified Listeria TaxID=2642072 RepID=UPI000B5904AE|nr:MULTISPECIES: competence protein CoiA family protein [unclassified Listeria]